MNDADFKRLARTWVKTVLTMPSEMLKPTEKKIENSLRNIHLKGYESGVEACVNGGAKEELLAYRKKIAELEEKLEVLKKDNQLIKDRPWEPWNDEL